MFKNGGLQLQDTTFDGFVTFFGARFSAREKKSKYSLPCSRCEFKDFVIFSNSDFSGNDISFEQSIFHSHTDFKDLKKIGQLGSLSFRNSQFRGGLELTAENAGAGFNCVPDFRGTHFSAPFSLSGFKCKPKKNRHLASQPSS